MPLSRALATMLRRDPTARSATRCRRRKRSGRGCAAFFSAWANQPSRIGDTDSMSSAAKELLGRIESRQARVGVIGLGYVGLPLAVEFARSGFFTTGIDVDGRKIDAIRQG